MGSYTSHNAIQYHVSLAPCNTHFLLKYCDLQAQVRTHLSHFLRLQTAPLKATDGIVQLFLQVEQVFT